MQKTFVLTERASKALAERHGTPLLVLSTQQIQFNYELLKRYLPQVKIHYAVKANPDVKIIETLRDLGSSFDVASDGEILDLNKLGVEPNRIIYANPVKTSRGFKVAKQCGVDQFTYDSESEVYKMAAASPGAKVLLRIRIDNPEAWVDLNKKFGAPREEALHLLKLAQEQGLNVAGVCFHVGSQSTSVKAYLHAMSVCREIFDEAQAAGLELKVLDIGGGFPIPTLQEKVDIEGLLMKIAQGLEQYFPDTEIWAEPGRFICGTAVNLITQVIGKKTRNSQPWYFLDDGLYGTFSGVIFDHWEYEMVTFRSGELEPSTLAGPSCDSLDILYKDKLLPPLEVQDLLLVVNCGAYTSASATVFNGFAKADRIIWEEQDLDC